MKVFFDILRLIKKFPGQLNIISWTIIPINVAKYMFFVTMYHKFTQFIKLNKIKNS